MMRALNFTLNSVTMLALVLMVGVVIDDAIVVLENIFRHVEEGVPRKQAAIQGAREIGFAVIALDNDARPYASIPSFATVNNASSWTNANLAGCTPLASFLVSAACVGDPLAFLDTSRLNPTSWTWDFGDGTPTDSTQNPSHTYTTPGLYTVTLTACNAYGCSQDARLVSIWELPLADLVATYAKCIVPGQATVIALDARGSQPGSGASLLDPGGYNWSVVGLGAVGPGQASTNTLTVPADQSGHSDVSVAVHDSPHSCAASITKPVDLFAPPVASVVAPAARCADRTNTIRVTLDASATTFAARCSESFWLYASVPFESVCPSTTMRLSGYCRKLFARSSSVIGPPSAFDFATIARATSPL